MSGPYTGTSHGQALGLVDPVARLYVPEKLFRDAPDQCVDCHEQDDVHLGKQGKECDSCHSANNWREAKFDHGKTAFPLKGAHERATCNQCHRSPDFKQTPGQCVDCHKIDDVHLNQFGPKCESCHATVKWSTTGFNHQRDTEFKLEGAHQALSCPTCHKSGTQAADLPRTCHGCHQQDDVHKDAMGSECSTCHHPVGWGVWRFDHDRQTEFSLQGAHKGLSCDACHAADASLEQLKQGGGECGQCHQAEDVHRGAYGMACDGCHDTSNFSTLHMR